MRIGGLVVWWMEYAYWWLSGLVDDILIIKRRCFKKRCAFIISALKRLLKTTTELKQCMLLRDSKRSEYEGVQETEATNYKIPIAHRFNIL